MKCRSGIYDTKKLFCEIIHCESIYYFPLNQDNVIFKEKNLICLQPFWIQKSSDDPSIKSLHSLIFAFRKSELIRIKPTCEPIFQIEGGQSCNCNLPKLYKQVSLLMEPRYTCSLRFNKATPSNAFV